MVKHNKPEAQPPPPGIYVPAVVFYDEKDELDLVEMRKHILRLASAGITGILVQGSNGEAQHLSHDERKETIRFTRRTLNEAGFDKMVIIAGTGAQSLKETVELCKDASEAGATFSLVLTPSTWAPAMNKDAILKFHRQVADLSPIPCMIYNFPTVTASIDLDSDTLIALSKHPNIVGCKLSCGNVGKLARIVQFTDEHPQFPFAAFIGKSDSFLASLDAGGTGLIGALVNVVPRLHVELYKSWAIDARPWLVKEDEFNGFATPRFDAFSKQQLLSCGDWQASKLGGIGGIKVIVLSAFRYGNRRVRLPLTQVTDQRLDACHKDDKELWVSIAKEKELTEETPVLRMEWPEYTSSTGRYFGPVD